MALAADRNAERHTHVALAADRTTRGTMLGGGAAVPPAVVRRVARSGKLRDVRFDARHVADGGAALGDVELDGGAGP